MGEYGMIHQDFWIDFEDVPVKEKLFLVYLFSNVRTNISGLYKIPLKVFTRDLRFSEKEVKEALRKAEELKFAYYDYDTSWVWVKGLAKRNMASEQQIKGIIKQVKKCESNILLKKFKEYYKEKGNFWQCFKEFLDTLSIPYHTLSPVSDSDSVSVTDPKDTTKNTSADFEKIWLEYPRKLGKKEALRHFLHSIKDGSSFENIWGALKNYKADIEKKGTAEKYIQHGSTWFNNWRDWIGYKSADDIAEEKEQRDREERQLRLKAEVELARKKEAERGQ